MIILKLYVTKGRNSEVYATIEKDGRIIKPITYPSSKKDHFSTKKDVVYKDIAKFILLFNEELDLARYEDIDKDVLEQIREDQIGQEF